MSEVPGDVETPAASTDDARGAAPALTRGTVLGRYVVLQELGAGGMGVVYAAYDPELDRKVALKLLLPSKGGRAASAARLQREAQALAKLSHPNVVAVHDVGMVGERVYVAMEFVQGRTVTHWLGEAKQSWREVVGVFVQAGHGLSAAHAEGLLHRDVKPDNLMVDEHDRVRVMDFGLARTTSVHPERSQPDGLAESKDALGSELTQPGSVMGTPAYMAPEQFESGAIDARTDQFGLCVAFWEALYGERPFSGESLAALAFNVTQGKRRDAPTGSKVPRWLRRVVERGLSVAPDERWPSMEALLSELSRDPGRRRVWWLGGAAVLAVGGGAGAMWFRHDAQLCSRAAAELAEVWHDERREAVRAGLLATEVSYASGVWERAAPKLDAWASEWEAMHTEACEATRRAKEQSVAVMDLRIGCLYRARQGLDAAAKVLSAATREVVQNAHDVVAALPRLSRCADIEALQADVRPPEADEAEAVEAIRAGLAEAAAQRKAGAYGAALAAVGRAEVQLEDVEYEPMRTEVDLELGLVQNERGEYAEAEAALRRAQRGGARWEQREAFRDATRKLVFVLGSQLRRHAEALALREVAEGLSTDTPDAEASTRNVLALVLHGQGKYAEAEAEHRVALALRLETLGADHPAVAESRNNLAGVLYEQGRSSEAEAELRAALALWIEALGADHPGVAESRNSLGGVLYAQGKYAEAGAEHRRALAVRLETLDAGHPEIATSRSNLALVLHAEGNYAEAEAENRAALALRLETFGADHPHVAASRNNLAAVLRAQGNHAEAEAEYRVALTLLLETLGADHPRVATSRYNLATVLRDQGRLAEAEVEQRAALALWIETLGANHPKVARARSSLATVLHGQGKYAEAETELRAALTLRLETLGADHPDIARSRLNLARTLLARSKGKEALLLLEESWTVHERAPLPEPLGAKTAFALAEAMWAQKRDRIRARTLARQAAELHRQANTPDAKEQQRVEDWLRQHGGNR